MVTTEMIGMCASNGCEFYIEIATDVFKTQNPTLLKSLKDFLSDLPCSKSVEEISIEAFHQLAKTDPDVCPWLFYNCGYLLPEVDLVDLVDRTIPIIYQNHELEEHLDGLFSLSGWVQRAERIWIHRANLVVFPDRDRATFFQQVTGLKQEPIIVPNFPRQSFFTLPENWISVIPKRWQSISLFYRGSISDTSAMKEIVSAATLVKPFHNNISVKFVGFLNYRDRQELQTWVDRQEMSDYVSYLGTLPYKDLQHPTFLATIGFALYKNTSFDRVACVAACNKIYEYAACGLPVIVSDFRTYRAFLGDEPWVRFADPENPLEIASAIQDLLGDFENYRELCLAARKAFTEKFNYESVFAPLLAHIQNYDRK